MTPQEATQELARLNRLLALLTEIEARGPVLSEEDLRTVKAVQESAAHSLAQLQAYRDMQEVIQRVMS
jgi:hypothetical protein